MSTRAGIVVTGTEVLTGRVADRNGPWLAERLRLLGVDIAHTIVVGDRAEDLLGSLRFLVDAGVDLIITSGGLGPTADDLTAEIVGEFQGRPLRLDFELEDKIGSIIARLATRLGWNLDADATAAATRKQAMVPEGGAVLGIAGTAPGLVVPAADGRDGPPVIVLPGPPRELQAMWPAATADASVLAAIAGRRELRQATIRLWGSQESELAAVLRDLDGQLTDLEITTCLRDGELEIVTRYAPDAQPAYDKLAAAIGSAFAETLLSTDGRTIDDLVADALIERGLTIATAESCTAGLLAGRLTERAGSSRYLRGGLVVYSNEAKHDLAGVPAELLERVGAVSAEVAEALAQGARERLRADIGIGITGVAGPDGGTPDKPVGLVHLCVAGDEAVIARHITVRGSRHEVRNAAVIIALHLVRELLER